MPWRISWAGSLPKTMKVSSARPSRGSSVYLEVRRTNESSSLAPREAAEGRNSLLILIAVTRHTWTISRAAITWRTGSP